MNAKTNIEINNTTIMCSGVFQFLYLTLDFLVNQGQKDHLNETCQPLESLTELALIIILLLGTYNVITSVKFTCNWQF